MSDKQKLTEKLVQEARKGSPTSLRSLLYYLLAVVYVVSPLDFVPDVLPGLGQICGAFVETEKMTTAVVIKHPSGQCDPEGCFYMNWGMPSLLFELLHGVRKVLNRSQQFLTAVEIHIDCFLQRLLQGKGDFLCLLCEFGFDEGYFLRSRNGFVLGKRHEHS